MAFTTILVPVTDLARGRDFYRALVGIDPFVDSAYYVGFQCGDIQLGLHGNGNPGAGGPIAYWDTDDIAGAQAALVNAGGTVAQEPTDVGGGMLVGTVTDPDGNVIGIRQPPAA